MPAAVEDIEDIISGSGDSELVSRVRNRVTTRARRRKQGENDDLEEIHTDSIIPVKIYFENNTAKICQ